MIVIRMEMWPGGSPERKYLLGSAIIANDGTGTQTVGHYRVRIGRRGVDTPLKPFTKPWKTGVVTNFPRMRLGAWDLLYRALKEILGARNEA